MTTVDRVAQERENTRRFRPTIGRSVTPSIIRLVVAVGLVLLSVAVIGWQWWLALALFLVMATMVFPKAPGAWGLAALLAVFSLGDAGSGPTWKFFVVLAAAHLIHVVGMTLSWLPIGGAVELGVIARILRSFVLIQVPVQLVSFVVLTLLAGRSVAQALTSPAFALLAGIAFVLLVAIVLVPIIRDGRRN